MLQRPAQLLLLAAGAVTTCLGCYVRVERTASAMPPVGVTHAPLEGPRDEFGRSPAYEPARATNENGPTGGSTTDARPASPHPATAEPAASEPSRPQPVTSLPTWARSRRPRLEPAALTEDTSTTEESSEGVEPDPEDAGLDAESADGVHDVEASEDGIEAEPQQPG